MSGQWHTGNAGIDGVHTNGWLLGAAGQDSGDVRSTEVVDVRWGVHPAGQQRDGWSTGERRTTLLVLVSGCFRLELDVATCRLENPGDYAVWGPGIEHSWTAEQDSVVVGVRWPATP